MFEEECLEMGEGLDGDEMGKGKIVLSVLGFGAGIMLGLIFVSKVFKGWKGRGKYAEVESRVED